MVKSYIFNSERQWHYPITVLFTALSLLFSIQLSGQLACNNSVQVSLNFDCEAEITPAMILEGEDEDNLDNYFVTIQGITGNIVSNPGSYSVTVTEITTGNSCWGNINVEDKLAPQIISCDCPPGNFLPECQFLCSDLEGILNNTAVVPQPIVEENCGAYVSEYADQISDGGCGEKVILRSWLFTDNSGNQTTGCTQQFRTLAIDIADILPPVSPVILGCGADVSMPAIVEYYTPIVGADLAVTYGFPTVNGIAIDGALCNLISTKVDIIIPACDQSCSNSFKVIREWTVLDWCASQTVNYNQIIKAVDEDAPTIQAQDMTVSTDPWVCAANFYLQAPSILHDDCTSFVEYAVTGPAGVAITYDPQLDLYFASNLSKGVHTFVYRATDCCGNTADDPIIVTVVDQTAPVAVAKQNIVVSLTQSGTGEGIAKIFAPSVDNGSHDGCTNVKLEIRRDSDVCGVIGNATYNNDGHPNDANNDPDGGQWVKFCCEDLTNAEVDVDGDGVDDPGYVKVWLRVWDDGDMNGLFGSSGDNYNETWSFIKVEDKLNPTIQCPPNITIACDDDADDLGITGTATASFTCAGAEVTYNDIVNTVDNCGVGFIRRRWSVVGAATVFCDQDITKSAGTLFNGNINWPADYTTDCTDTNANGDDVPTWTAPSCALIGYSLESDTFQFEDGACFKILNEWTVLDWCQYDPNTQNSAGIWKHIQIIKVVDDEAPVLTCTDQMYAVDDNNDADNDGNTCETKSLMLTNTADDNGDCASQWLKWTVLIDLWGDGTFDYEYSTNLPSNDNNFNDTNGNGIPDVYLAATASGEQVKVTLPIDIPGSMSNHKVRWKVSDGCLNVTSCENNFMVVDKKAPTPYCIDISTALMESGMVEIWACDFDLGSFDNCTAEENLRFTFTNTRPQNDPNFDDETGCSSRIFDCDDLSESPVAVTMYVWDEKDNFDFCEIMLTLVDNQGGCEDGNGMRISGLVSTPTNTPISDLEVKLTAPAIEIVKYDMTNDEGGFTFFNNPDQASYNISASKDGNDLDGVSTLDLVIIQRHILGLQLMDDVYKTIAADINNDEKLSAADLLQLRKLILGVITELPHHDSYQLVDAAQIFADINDPWPLQTDINISPLEVDMIDQNLIAIKIGDVNNNAQYGLIETEQTTTRSAHTLGLEIEDQILTAGQNSSLEVKAINGADLQGMQLSILVSDMDNITINSGILDINESTYAVDGELIHISWTPQKSVEVTSGDILFTIEGTAAVNGSVSESVTVPVVGALSPEAYDADLNISNVEVVVRSSSVKTDAFVVKQNEPNPFDEVTVISYALANAGQVSISISDISGKIVHTQTTNAPAGVGQFSVTSDDLQQSGIYYYTVSSADHTVTKKMIMIK